MKFVKLVVFVPTAQAAAMRKALAESGCGQLGRYSACSFSSVGYGRFLPEAGAQPEVGRVGRLTRVREERIEVLAPRRHLRRIISQLKAVHPYEEPAIDLIPLLDLPE